MIGLALALQAVIGCSGGRASSPAQLEEFLKAGPAPLEVDQSKVLDTNVIREPYRAGADDVLNVQLVNVVRPEVEEPWQGDGRSGSYHCRVSSDGYIVIPLAGKVQAAGKTLGEIENLIAAAYCPRYVAERPNVYAKVEEYQTAAVSIVGAVAAPGVYDLRRDEMTLVSALMKAGNIKQEGACAINVRRAGQTDSGQRIILPVKGLNVPFSNVGIQNGDVIEVQRLIQQDFMVIGLVNKAGAYPYPPGQEYSVGQALAFAGGLNEVAAPDFARVYRKAPDGEIVSVDVSISGTSPVSASSVMIKPGDIVAVEHTGSTKTRMLVSQIIRGGVFVGASYNLAQQ